MAILLSVSLLTQSILPAAAENRSHSKLPAKLGEYPAQWGYKTPEPYYAEILADYVAKGYQPAAAEAIDVAGMDYSGQSNADLKPAENVGGKTGTVLEWGEGDGLGWVEWTFNVKEAGLYNLGIEYYPLPAKGASIQRDLKIDGKYPFNEARRLEFERNWVDAHPVERDNQGNDIRPSQVEAPTWRNQLFEDALQMYRAPYEFYLEPGKHIVRLGVIREPLAIASISLLPPPDVPMYKDLQDTYRAKGYQPSKDVLAGYPGGGRGFQIGLHTDPKLQSQPCGNSPCGREFPPLMFLAAGGGVEPMSVEPGASVFPRPVYIRLVSSAGRATIRACPPSGL